MSKDRVQILDSFRCIAVIGVMLCHYTFRYNDTPAGSLYPFGNFYGSLFKYGFMGVEFFFIISGFVISFTLENTDSFSSFCKKRFIRLFPAMLLCSVIIFLICSLLDNKGLFPDAHDARNFLPSLTFTKPDLWDFTGHKFGLINWSYWSLWPEIQFYILSSVIYFSDRKNFFRNLVWGSILVYLFRYIPAHFIATPGKYHHFFEAWDHLFKYFDIPFYVLWFAMGTIVYYLYKGTGSRISPITGIGVVLLLAIQYHACLTWDFKILFVLMVGLFLCMIYKQKYLSFLVNPLFTRIGVISYSIYLIHENIGVLLMNKYGGSLGKLSFLSPFIMILLVILFAELSFRFYENWAGRWLKKLLFRKSQSPKTILAGNLQVK